MTCSFATSDFKWVFAKNGSCDEDTNMTGTVAAARLVLRQLSLETRETEPCALTTGAVGV